MLSKEFRLKIQITALVIFSAGLLGASARAQSSPDKAIVTTIQTKLFADSILKTRDIRVACQDGVVTLTGSVHTELERAAVERIASQEPGVRQVIDSLAISEASGSQAAPAPASPPPSVTIAAGTVVTVRMIDAIDSAKNYPGEEFDATVFSPIVVGDRVVVPQNSNARVRLVNVKSAGHFKGRSELQLELVSLTVNGTPYPVQSGYYETQGASRGKRSAETVGGGAGLGALIGAIAGGGRGAAIGAGIGAAGGGGVQAATKGQQAQVASEAKIDFTLKNPLVIGASGTTVPAPPAATAAPQGLTGTWKVYIQGLTAPLQISIQQTGQKVVGTVVTGNAYIPAGKMVFYGTYNSNPFQAQEICTHLNYTSPYWIPVTFKVIDNNHLQENTAGGTACNGFPALWERDQ